MRWFLFLILPLLILTLLVFSAPTLLSTGPGTRFLLSLANRNIPGRITLSNLRLSWFGSQTVTDLTLLDPSGSPILEVPSLSTDTSLLSFLFRGRGIGTATATQPTLTLVYNPDGSTSLDRALSGGTATTGVVAVPLLSGTLQIVDGTVSIQLPGGLTSSIDHLNIELEIAPQLTSLFAKLDGQSSQGPISGHLAYNLTTSELDAQFQARSFPMPLLDAFVSLLRPNSQNFLTRLLGPTLDLDISTQDNRIAVSARSSQSSLSFQGALSDETFRLTQPFQASLQITPDSGRLLLSQFNLFLTDVIRSEAPITLTVSPEDFRLTRDAITAPHITLELGKLWARNTGSLQRLLSLFPSTAPAEVRIWSTPLYASLRSNKLTLSRVDMLIHDDLQLASWGEINLLNQSLNMRFAIPTLSLSALLRTTLPADDYLVLAATGELHNPRIRWDRLAAQVASLLLPSPLLRDLTRRDVPAATTQPFPWPSPVQSETQPLDDLKRRGLRELRRRLTR